MYIQKAEITNIKSIKKFEIEFPNPAGWHVLIGDNGSGKTTIIQSMVLALVGAEESQALRLNWNDWLNNNNFNNHIKLFASRNSKYDEVITKFTDEEDILFDAVVYERPSHNTPQIYGHLMIKQSDNKKTGNVYRYTQKQSGFFSSAFGPYRRFESGSEEWKAVFENPSLANLAAHLSLFGEDVAFTEIITWLKYLDYQSYESNKKSQQTLENIKRLVNHENEGESFLPHNAKLEKVNSEGVFFKDGNGVAISINQMSDGYRSALSLLFELIRQLVRVYGSELVFKNIEKGDMFIDLPGVVLIDEIDAHLHPTWQTRIGQWFLKYFPQLQFIVTTHSPLVCRACEKGSIWKLAAPGSDEVSGEVTGIDRERLIYGNVLDAYGTGVFGENTSISEESNDMLNRLSELNVKSMMGLINKKESEELQELRAKFPTENKIKLPEELKR